MFNKNSIVDFVNTTLKGDSAPLTKFLAIKAKLLETKVGRVDVVHVSDMLCHQSNRGGTGINPYNAHKQLARVHKAGANLSLLNQATCVELHPVGHPQRQQDIDWNKNLVSACKGMLADITGTERFQSLSNGHTTAGCRAANAGCKTTYKDISDAAGNINASMLKNKSKDMSTMLEVGWEWFIVPCWLPEECPEFCHLCSSALNAVNQLHTVAGEVETGLQLVEELAFCGNNWDAAIEACSATEPPCKEYITSVAKYVQDFCGKQSEGYPIIQFLATYAQNCGASVLLGQQFTHATATLEFPKSLNQFDFVRCACIATNLTSTGAKLKDNIGRILTVSDLNSLKSKDKLPLIKDIESILAQCYESMELFIHEGTRTVKEAYAAYGRLCFRLILHLFSKEKWGLDTTVYKNNEEIQALFTKEMGSPKEPSAVAESASAAVSAAPDDAEVGPVAVAKRKFNMVVGKFYENKKEHANKHFKLTKFTTDGATFQQLSIIDDKPPEIAVPIGFDNLKTWRQLPSSFKPQELLTVDHTIFNKSSDFEALRAEAWLQLKQLHDENAVVEGDFKFTVQPCHVLAGRDFAKGELKLVPMPDTISKLSKPKDGDDVSAATCFLNGQKLVISPPSKQPFLKYMAGELPKDKLEKDKPSLAAYWWVKELDASTTKDKDKKPAETPNMEFKSSGKFTKILTNSKAIKKNEVLMVRIPKKKKKA